MGGTLMLEPASRVPKELMNEIKQYKDDLLDVLPKDAELDDIVRHVREDGYVLLWSNVLEDSVAFIHDDFDPVRLPHGFVPYTLSELSKLFADGSLSADSLRLIHVAKKHGGKVTDVS
jgi:hypothetical protein